MNASVPTDSGGVPDLTVGVPFEEYAKSLALALVGTWVHVEAKRKLRNLYLITLVSLIPLLLIGNMTLLLGFSFALFLFSVRESLRITTALTETSEVIAPALSDVPNGLDDPRLGIEVLTKADVLRVAPGLRKIAVAKAAAWAVGPDGPARFTDCTQGHPRLCSHRCSAASVQLWSKIAELAT